jgi:glycine cleavage system H protein
MVVLLFITTIVIFLGIDYFLRKRTAVQTIASAETAKGGVKSYALFSEPYFHPTHSWARVTDDVITVGVDEFSQKIIGKVQRLDVPPVGSYIKQGETAWKLHNGKRILPQSSPVEGEVVEINPELMKNPEMINKSPYNTGWILKIRPSGLRQSLKNLLHGEQAMRWLDSVRSQFILRFAGQVGPVCQDGGELIEGAGNLLSENEWNEVLKEYFMVD